jgi:hypothetical protein
LFDGEDVGITGSGLQELHHRRKRIIGVVQQDVPTPNGRKDVVIVVMIQGWRRRRQKRGIFQVIAIDLR